VSHLNLNQYRIVRYRRTDRRTYRITTVSTRYALRAVAHKTPHELAA